jgi:RNA polymerase sigma-70 factor (ECF subfamily)
MASEANSEHFAASTPQTVLNRDDEAALVVDARGGSAVAIQSLIGRYERRLFRLAWNITSNHEDAEEVVQNAFVKAFQNLSTFQGTSRFYTWLVRIAVNEALMKIRRIRRRRVCEVSVEDTKENDDSAVPRELQDWRPNPEHQYSQVELRTILERTINELDPAYRIVLHLRDIQELSTEETARTLDLSPAAVKARLRRARLQVRDALHNCFRWPRPRHLSTGQRAARRGPRQSRCCSHSALSMSIGAVAKQIRRS